MNSFLNDLHVGNFVPGAVNGKVCVRHRSVDSAQATIDAGRYSTMTDFDGVATRAPKLWSGCASPPQVVNEM